jgi:hypothetical protein
MGRRIRSHFGEAIAYRETIYLPIRGEPVRKTEKAVLIRLKRTGNEVWMPKSVVEDSDDIEPGEQDFLVAEWFIEQNDLPT